jgi:hypothetical protein
VNDLHHQDDDLRDLFVDSAPRLRHDYVAVRQSVAKRVTRIRRRRTAGGVVAAATVLLLGTSAWAASQRNPNKFITQSPVTTEVRKTTTTSVVLPTALTVATSAVETIAQAEPISDTAPETPIIEAPQTEAPIDATGDAAVPPVTRGPGQPPRSTPTTVARRVPTTVTPTTVPRPASTTAPTKPPTTAPQPTTTSSGDRDNGGSGEQSYVAAGGSARVQWANNTLTLVSTTPKTGWTVVKTTATAEKIEIIFGNGGLQSRLKVELDNGHPKSEHDD